MSDFSEKIAGLAEKRHPADLPSPADLEASGWATYARKITVETPVSNIIARVFKELGVKVENDFDTYVAEQQKLFRQQERNGLHLIEEHIQERVDEESALRVMFGKLKVTILDERGMAAVNELEHVHDAELLGRFIVEQALPKPVSADTEAFDPTGLRTAS